MYYVEIDLQQLQTRLRESTEISGENNALADWLNEAGFVQSGDGWLADADAMNRLSCSEITFSEATAVAEVPRAVRLMIALEHWRRQHTRIGRPALA